MKRLFLLSTLAAAISAAALDNTVVNDFWDTTGYVNGATSAQSAKLGTAVDTRHQVTRATAAPARFSTYNATLLIIR